MTNQIIRGIGRKVARSLEYVLREVVTDLQALSRMLDDRSTYNSLADSYDFLERADQSQQRASDPQRQ